MNFSPEENLRHWNRRSSDFPRAHGSGSEKGGGGGSLCRSINAISADAGMHVIYLRTFGAAGRRFWILSAVRIGRSFVWVSWPFAGQLIPKRLFHALGEIASIDVFGICCGEIMLDCRFQFSKGHEVFLLSTSEFDDNDGVFDHRNVFPGDSTIKIHLQRVLVQDAPGTLARSLPDGFDRGFLSVMARAVERA